MSEQAIEPGAPVEVPYPFINMGAPNDYGDEFSNWKPGTRQEQIAQDDFAAEADAIGAMILTVVATFKPGRYPTRVFYTRQWRDPSGMVFGKNGLRVTTTTAFRRLLAGYRYPFDLHEVPKIIVKESA